MDKRLEVFLLGILLVIGALVAFYYHDVGSWVVSAWLAGLVVAAYILMGVNILLDSDRERTEALLVAIVDPSASLLQAISMGMFAIFLIAAFSEITYLRIAFDVTLATIFLVSTVFFGIRSILDARRREE